MDFHSFILSEKKETNEFVTGELKGKLKNSTKYISFKYDMFIPLNMKNGICKYLGYDNLHSLTFFENFQNNSKKFIFELKSYFQFKVFVLFIKK